MFLFPPSLPSPSTTTATITTTIIIKNMNIQALRQRQVNFYLFRIIFFNWFCKFSDVSNFWYWLILQTALNNFPKHPKIWITLPKVRFYMKKITSFIFHFLWQRIIFKIIGYFSLRTVAFFFSTILE